MNIVVEIHTTVINPNFTDEGRVMFARVNIDVASCRYMELQEAHVNYSGRPVDRDGITTTATDPLLNRAQQGNL